MPSSSPVSPHTFKQKGNKYSLFFAFFFFFEREKIFEIVFLSTCGLVAKSCSVLATPWTVAHQLLCPWNFLGKNTGVDCHAHLQGMFPTQGWNPGFLH